MRQLATEGTYFVALFIKANHVLSDNFHGVVAIVTESVENPTATHVHRKTYIVNAYHCKGSPSQLLRLLW